MKIKTNGFSMGLTMRGRGMPLLFVHGFPLNKSMWQAQTHELANAFTVLAPDLRGHGQSDAPAGDYSMDLFADDLKTLLDHLGLPKVLLVGLSMGGYVAFAFQRKYPDSLLGLVLADTRAPADSPEAKQGREKTAQTVQRDGVGPVAKDLTLRLLAPTTVANNPELVEKVRHMLESTPVNGWLGDLHALANRPDSTPTLTSIRCPTLVIVGAQDVVTPPADAAMLVKGISNALLVTIPNAGHLTPLEQPALFNRALRAFAEKLAA